MKHIFLSVFLLVLATFGMAQVGINDNGALPDASAMLDVNVNTPGANKKGFLLPRMTTAERGAIASPATGLIVYVTDAPNTGLWIQRATPPFTNWQPLSEGKNYWNSTLVGDGSIFNSNTLNVGIGTTNTSSSAKLHVAASGMIYGGLFNNSNASSNTHVVHAEYTGANADAIGVYGKSASADYWGIGGSFVGGFKGVEASVLPTGNGFYYGGFFNVSGTGNGTATGVHANATSGGSNYGLRANVSGGSAGSPSYAVYASATGGNINGAAGYFSSGSGNALVTDQGNVGIGISGALRAKLEVNGSVGAVGGLFSNGAGTPGIAIENNLPGIAFNSFYNGGRKLLAAGYGANLSYDHNAGSLGFYSTTATGTAGATASPTLKMLMTAAGNLGLQGNSNPQAPLSFASTLDKKISFYRGATGDASVGVYGNELRFSSDYNNADITFGYDNYTNGFTEKFRMKANGNMGIGTNNPQNKLEVSGRIRSGKDGIYGGGLWIDGPTVPGIAFLGMEDDNTLGFFSSNFGWGMHYDLVDGSFRIGTANKATGYALNIGGKAIAEEIRVQLQANWPDYVFADDYKLMPLPELEKYVKANRHLPEIPAAAILEKEGTDLGEMQRKLMQKVEELTLYIIEQDKKIEQLQKQVGKQ